MSYVRMAVSTNPAKVNGIGASQIGAGFPDVVLANTHRWVLASSAPGHVVLCPIEPIVCRNGDTVITSRAAGRVRNINCPIRRYLHMAMDAAGALRWSKDWHTGSKGFSAVIATGTLGFSSDILRTIINCVLWPGRRIGGCNGRSARVRTTAKRFVVRARARTASAAGSTVRRDVAVPIDIRIRSGAVALPTE